MKDFNHALANPRLLALYAHLTIDDYFAVLEVRYADYDERYQPLPEGTRREVSIEGYVRITEPVEVTFRGVDNNSIVRNAVASLDEEERKLRSELHKKLTAIQDRKNQLLALTHQTESV